MKKIISIFLLFCSSSPLFITIAQDNGMPNEDAWMIRKIFDKSLTEGQCYPWLHFLTKKIGNRISGSPQSYAAIEFSRQMLDTLGLDSVWLMPCVVPHWSRGNKSIAKIIGSRIGDIDMKCLALGGSVATPDEGIFANVVEVKSLDEVEKLGKTIINGKIVFFNRPMDPTKINTFAAYGGAVDQRGSGASVAAKYGAVAVLVRSMTTRLDDIPHSGGVNYNDESPKIAAIAISTNDAERLSLLLKTEPAKVFVKADCKWLKEKNSFNVIGEIKGKEFPNEVIVVGGHLDSWDVGEGAHDDGAGCMQSMDVLNILKKSDYQPKRTIRCVLFMNEENGLRGGKAYGEYVKNSKEKHLAAIESDAGGFSPNGFECESISESFNQQLKQMQDWLPLLEPYGLSIKRGGSGADISPMRPSKVLLIGLRPDSQRYFDLHHTEIDTFEMVNKRELELGTASMTSLIYLLDKYGLK